MLDRPQFDPARMTADDPPPYRVIEAGGAAPRYVLIVDHASNAMPAHMAGLGLAQEDRTRHIAWDIGAAQVASLLSARLDAPAFLAGYSRLIIDCNRPLGVPTSIPTVSDRTTVPANQAVDAAEAAARADAFFWPYHNAVAATLDRLMEAGEVPVLVAVHSFTPVMDGFARPWQLGLLWEHDGRLVAPLRAACEALRPGICVGDNEPYAIRGPSDYSIPVHGQARGLPHIEIELRQDLIESDAGAAEWAHLVGDALERVYAAGAPFRIEQHAPSSSA